MTQILKILDVDDGKWKQDFSVFSFWELSFSGIFVKLSKEWDPPIWLVPSHNVSLQKSVWHSHSNPFFSLSLFLLLLFFSFTQSSLFSLTLHCSSTSCHHHTNPHHHEQPPNRAFVFFLSLSLSFLPLPDRFLSQAFFLSLSSLLLDHHHYKQPPRAIVRSVQTQPKLGLLFLSLSFLPL